MTLHNLIKIARTGSVLTFMLCASTMQTGTAAVSEAEAARLGEDLTPIGAERAGNSDGTIPEWKDETP